MNNCVLVNLECALHIYICRRPFSGSLPSPADLSLHEPRIDKPNMVSMDGLWHVYANVWPL